MTYANKNADEIIKNRPILSWLILIKFSSFNNGIKYLLSNNKTALDKLIPNKIRGVNFCIFVKALINNSINQLPFVCITFKMSQ